MALELESVDMDYKLLAYMRHVKAGKEELLGIECVVCGAKENKWDHYQLACKHYGHTRCIRKWLSLREKAECAWCMQSTPQKKYCKDCKKWGNHAKFDEKLCPTFIDFLTECDQEDYLSAHQDLFDH